MYRLLFALLLLPFLILTQSCSRKLALESSRFQSPALVIDGAGDDWNKLPRFYDSETKLSYDVSNDGKNLYIVMKAVDSEMKTRILRGGFNVWIDTTWQKKTDRGVKFPLASAERTMQFATTDDKKDKGTQGTKESLRNYARNITEMDLIGLANGKTTRTTAQNPYGVNAAVSMDKEGTLFYELAIPLNVIFKDSITMPLVKRKLSVGLVSNKPESKATTVPGDSNGNDQFGPKGTGSMHGGDMMQSGSGHGGYGQNGGGTQFHNTKYEPGEKQVNIWMLVQLVDTGTGKPEDKK